MTKSLVVKDLKMEDVHVRGLPSLVLRRKLWVAVCRSACPLYTELSRDFPDIWVALRVDSGVPKILIKQSGLTERMYIILYKTNSNEFSKFYGSSGRSNGGVIPRGRRR